MKFSGNSILAQGTNDLILLATQITILIQEFVKVFFITALLSDNRGVGPWWRYLLSEYCCFNGN